MCKDCGCALPEHSTAGGEVAPGYRLVDAPHTRGRMETARVLRRLLAANDEAAQHNRAHLAAHGVFAVNLMSSPGAGKTALLERSIRALGKRLRTAVVVGDLETDLDAERLRACGVPAVQISTGQACHLDARMVHEALHSLDLDAVDLLFIENVGNLVCPAGFDLGQRRNVVLLAATEGHDKPAKYPTMFRQADLVLVSKSDLIPVLCDFDPGIAESAVHRLANPAAVWTISARSGEGMDRWCAWLLEQTGRMGRGA